MYRSNRFVALLAASLLFVSGAAGAQQVYVVDQAGGPGTDFTTIGAALVAAVDGDSILIRKGTYYEILSFHDKGLILQAEDPGEVSVQGFYIRDLAPDQSVVIRGLNLTFNPAGIKFLRNQGPVWIEEMDSPILEKPFVFTECASVVLRNVKLPGQALPQFGTTYPDRLQVSQSNLTIYDSFLEAHPVGTCLPFGGPIPGVGIQVSFSSTVTLSGTTVIGGRGPIALPAYCIAGGGGPAISASSLSTVTAIRSTLLGGYDGSGARRAPAIRTSSGGVVGVLPNKTLHRLTSASPVREGASTTLALQGDPGDVAFAILTFAPGPLVGSANWLDVLAVAPPATLVSFGVLPAAGVSSSSLLLPPFPGLVTSFYAQGLFLSPTEIAFGAPTQVHVYDPSVY